MNEHVKNNPNLNQNSKTNDPIGSSFRLLYILLAFAGLIAIALMFYNFYQGDRMANKYVPLTEASEEIKLEVTTAHLWFEEIIMGDKYESMDVVWMYLIETRVTSKVGTDIDQQYDALFIDFINHTDEKGTTL